MKGPIATAALLIFLAAGCAPDDRADPHTNGDGTLTAEALAALKAEHPRLGEDPLPEPRPNDDADPDRVPERVREQLPASVLEQVTGDATFYADYFEGRRTASGIPFRQNQMVAAHRAYPFGTLLRVTNLSNNQSVNVKVVDRGPFGAAARRPVIDLSRRAAQQLGFIAAGRTQVRIDVLEWGTGVAGAIS
jgi:rare lipoprotein A